MQILRNLMVAVLGLALAQGALAQNFQAYSQPQVGPYAQPCVQPRPSRLLGLFRILNSITSSGLALSNSQRTTRRLLWAQGVITTSQTIKEVQVDQANYSRALACYNSAFRNY